MVKREREIEVDAKERKTRGDWRKDKKRNSQLQHELCEMDQIFHNWGWLPFATTVKPFRHRKKEKKHKIIPTAPSLSCHQY